MLSEISQWQRTNASWFHLYELSKRVNLTDSEYNVGFQGVEKGENGDFLINGHKNSIKQNK